MNNSFGTLLQKLRTISWWDWIVYSLFVLTFVGLWILADEVYWQSDVYCARLTATDDGRLIGVNAITFHSNDRNRFYLFDDDLQLKKSLKLKTRTSWVQHAISEDGKYLIYGVREPSLWPESPEFIFELVALDGSQPSTQIILSDPIGEKKLGNMWLLNAVLGLELIGRPPNSFMLRTSNEMFVVDLSGQIVSYLDEISHNSTFNRDYAVATALLDRKWVLGGYAVDSNRLKQTYYEYPKANPPNSFPGGVVLSAGGLFAIQEKDRIRIVDLHKNENLAPEIIVPWLLSKGRLMAISGDANTLLLGDTKNLYAFSIQDQKVIGQLTIPDPFYVFTPALLDNHRVVCSKSCNGNSESSLMIWNWNDSTTKEVSFGNHSMLTKQLIYSFFVVTVAVWTACFYVFAVGRKNTWFGIAVLTVATSVFIRWTHLAPEADRVVISYRDLQILLPPVLCQVGLSVVSLWAFRYLRFAFAAGLIFCLAAYTARWYHFLIFDNPYYFFDAKLYFQNMVLIFALGMVIAQSFIWWRSSKKLNATIGDLLVLTVAAAIVTKLLMDILLDQQDKNTVIFGFIGGTIHLVQTFYADRKSRAPLRLVSLIWLPLIAIGFFSSILLLGYVLFSFGIGMVGTVRFWLSLILSDLVVFFLTWALLRLVYYFFERPTTQGSSGLVAEPI